MKPANVSSWGSLVRATSPDGVAIVAGPGLRPGQGRRGEATIVNLGVLPADLLLLEVGASNEFAAGAVGLAIHELRDGTSRRIYLGEIGGLPGEGLDLGRFEAGESRTYRFTLLLAEDAPAPEGRQSVGAVYRWAVGPIAGASIRD